MSTGDGVRTGAGATTAPSRLRTVVLVARREFVTRVRTKAYLISTAAILAVIVGGPIIATALDGPDDPLRVVVVGADDVGRAVDELAGPLDLDVTVTSADDDAAARVAVDDGSADIALVSGADGRFVVLTRDDPDPADRALVETAAQRVALDRALAAQGVDRQELGADLSDAAVEVVVLDPADPDEGQRSALAYVAVLLLFFSVYLYGLYVAMGVVEEKSSRVVEVLLATIRPLDLLVGKVVGIGLVGLLQVLLFGGAGVAAGVATGLISIGGTAGALFGVVVLWYVLGFAFFATLYAGFGSLVSRQEDVNAATTPLSVLAFGTFFAAQAALADPESRWVEVLAWVPPFSATIVPVRVAAGVSNPVEAIGSAAVMLVATVVAAVLAARVYESSVLDTGARRSLRRALSR
jgi:ABC-2 type transport system permease protein